MASHTITFFEHQFRTYEALRLPGGPASRERILEDIDRLNHANGQEILRLERKGIRATQQVGVLRVGEVTVEILPKIDVESAESDASVSATHNLLVMLSYAFNLHISEVTIADLSTQDLSWFELLTRLFSIQLYRQILSGVSHNYVVREETLPVLRGRWNLHRQLRHGQARHTFDVTYDDFSPDITLNQVFRFVVEQLQGLSNDPDNRALLGDLRDWFSPVTLLPEIPAGFLDAVQFSRLNERFLPVFNMARLFLSGSAIQLRHGAHPLYAFVFDMNMLFERFTAAFLRHYQKAIFPAGWKDVTLLPQSEHYLAKTDGQKVIRLRPDLLFKRKGQPAPLLIADTKYKLLDPSQRRLGVSQDDIYQMLAYAVRWNCPRVMLLYPQSAETGELRKRFEIETANVHLLVNTINLRTRLDQPAQLIEELRALFRTAEG